MPGLGWPLLCNGIRLAWLRPPLPDVSWTQASEKLSRADWLRLTTVAESGASPFSQASCIAGEGSLLVSVHVSV